MILCVNTLTDVSKTYETDYFVLGTYEISDKETDPGRGRILLFEEDANRKIRLATTTDVEGAVYAIAPVGNALAAAVNGTVCRDLLRQPRVRMTLSSGSDVLLGYKVGERDTAACVHLDIRLYGYNSGSTRRYLARRGRHAVSVSPAVDWVKTRDNPSRLFESLDPNCRVHGGWFSYCLRGTRDDFPITSVLI